MTAKFSLGAIVATPGALRALHESRQQPADFLARHLAGDWGDLDAEDKSLNDQALEDGSRLFSAYQAPGTRLYVITEAVEDDGIRAATTLLLPDEY